MRHHYELRHEQDYIAKLTEDGDTCREIVFFKGEQIHRAEFPASTLGAANRGDYLRSMAASVAREHKTTLVQTEHERVQAANLARVSSAAYRRSEKVVKGVERGIRQSAR